MAGDGLKVENTVYQVSVEQIWGDFLFSNDFYQDALATSSIEFAIEDLFPRTKIKFTICYSHNDLTPHDLAFHVRIGIVFTSVIMAILVDRLMWRQLLQPFLIILVQS